MKRTLKTLMILVMAMLLMTGCGNDKSEESNVTSDANTDINADANEVGGTFNTGKDYPIDIKDIDWRVESGGEIVIRVEVRSHLWITVTDNGCGMSMEKLDEVRRGLNDFENLDRTHIGICNVNQRIKLQYGEDYGVEFESKTGAGTKVCIKLPVLTSEIM